MIEGEMAKDRLRQAAGVDVRRYPVQHMHLIMGGALEPFLPVAEVILGLLPGVGTVVAIYEAMEGRTILTGQQLEGVDRYLGLVLAGAPLALAAVSRGGSIVSGLVRQVAARSGQSVRRVYRLLNGLARVTPAEIQAVQRVARGGRASAAELAAARRTLQQVTDEELRIAKGGIEQDKSVLRQTQHAPDGDGPRHLPEPQGTTPAGHGELVPPRSPLASPGGLSAAEGTRIPSVPKKGPAKLGPPAHALEKHGPEVPLSKLRDRVRDGEVGTASKFVDRAHMEEAISRTIDANQARIESWLKTKPPAGANLQLSHDPGIGRLGVGFRMGAGGSLEAMNDLRKVMTIIKSDGKGGYLVQTAFPTP